MLYKRTKPWNRTEIRLEVTPNSRQFAITGFNAWTNSLKVKVRARAMKGEANKELLGELGKLFKAKATIKVGSKSKKKTIVVELPSEETSRKIQGILKP